MPEKQSIQSKSGKKTKTDISPKKTYRWLTNTWKDAQHHSLLEKCKSKVQWDITSYQSEWPSSKSLQRINAGEDMEKGNPHTLFGEGDGTPLQFSCLEIPWMEEPGRLQSMVLRRVGHDWDTSLLLFTSMHWRRKWQPTPVFLPGESQGWESLVGCRLWGRTESETTEVT